MLKPALAKHLATIIQITLFLLFIKIITTNFYCKPYTLQKRADGKTSYFRGRCPHRTLHALEYFLQVCKQSKIMRTMATQAYFKESTHFVRVGGEDTDHGGKGTQF